MNNYYHYHNYVPFQIYNKYSIGTVICQICHINTGIHLKLLHEFNSHGILVCNNDKCIIYSQEMIDDIFTKHPIYNLNLNRTDIKIQNNNIMWSTLKPNNSNLYFVEECIGLTYLVKGRMCIVLYSDSRMNAYSWGNSLTFDLKGIYETNYFSDEEIDSFPDPVKEYLGIPFHSIQLKFVD